MKKEENPSGKRIHRLIMLFCGAFMFASGLGAAYLAFSGEGGIPGILLASPSLKNFHGPSYHLPAVPLSHGPDFWRSWSPETFDLAQRQNHLILLNWTSAWSHECRLMDEITYADPQVRQWIREHVVAIRVDSDVRPDLARYVSHGWPTTAFLLPTGEVLSSGGFMSPDRFLIWANEVGGAWQYHRKDILDSRQKVHERAQANQEQLRKRVSREWTKPEAQKIVNQELENLSRDFDHTHGGFGRGPKFPSMQINRFLIELIETRSDSSAQTMLAAQLDGELLLIDSVAGGLYRYSDTPDWRSPHYEKLLGVQAQAIFDFSWAYAKTHEIRYRLAAERIENYVERQLKLKDGFYSGGQDADVHKPDGSWVEGSRYYHMTESQRAGVGMPHVGVAAYAASNADLAAAFITSGPLAAHKDWGHRGLLLLDKIWKQGVDSNGKVRHCLNGPGLTGLLEDELAVAQAEFTAYQQTRDRKHLQHCQLVNHFIQNNLLDPQSGGYRILSSMGVPFAAEGGWQAVDPDLTAGMALLLSDKTGLENKFLKPMTDDLKYLNEGQRLRSWVSTYIELVDPALSARLALRVAR